MTKKEQRKKIVTLTPTHLARPPKPPKGFNKVAIIGLHQHDSEATKASEGFNKCDYWLAPTQQQGHQNLLQDLTRVINQISQVQHLGLIQTLCET